MYHNIFKTVCNNDLPEITFYSLVKGKLTDEIKNQIEQKIDNFALFGKISYPYENIYTSFFDYSENFGVLLTLEHNWDVLQEGTKLNYDLIVVEWFSLLLFQQILTDAWFSCICDFPNDLDFFGSAFSINTKVIICDKEFLICTDFGDSKSEAWKSEINRLGKKLPYEKWIEL